MIDPDAIEAAKKRAKDTRARCFKIRRDHYPSHQWWGMVRSLTSAKAGHTEFWLGWIDAFDGSPGECECPAYTPCCRHYGARRLAWERERLQAQRDAAIARKLKRSLKEVIAHKGADQLAMVTDAWQTPAGSTSTDSRRAVRDAMDAFRD